ncbi:MAG: ATP-binding protein, partial [Opitutales bacterium]
MDGSFKFCSPSWERELGYSEDEILSMQVSDMVAESDRPAFCKTLDKVAAGATVANFETRVLTKSGARMGCVAEQPWMSWSFSSEPKLAMVFVSARCVTAQKETEKALQQARLRAEDANRAKSDFLAVMSHELRTPLNPILGFADMLIEEVETEEHKEILNTIVDSGNHMLSLIDEILEYSKIDAGKTQLEPAEFSLADFVEQKVHLMSGQIKEAPIKLHSSIDWGPVDESRAPLLIGDVGMIRQVCRNLISNAIKFTKQGRVDFDVAVKELEGDRAFVRFDVKDSGIGIADKDRSKLFTPFTQVQSGMTREYGGTGLGLAICKRLVEFMDGSIAVESKEGEGSTFSFTLPLVLRYGEANGAQSAEEPSRSGAGSAAVKLRGNVLLVEDNESNAYYIKRLVERCGVKVERVAQGESALEALRERDDFDLVLLDLHMPGIGGFETLKRIRSSDKNRIEKLPVNILTADASVETEGECRNNGADGILVKPVRPRDVYELLEKHLERN